MHQSRLGAIIIDCKDAEDLQAATQFWSQALGLEVAASQPDPQYVALSVPTGEVAVLLQRVQHESRIHIDIETDDQEAEARRLIALGAKLLATIKGWHVLEAPSGHRFCLINPNRAGFADAANKWPGDA
jgi:predicted enzyme related to lactoylglutathione lyase